MDTGSGWEWFTWARWRTMLTKGRIDGRWVGCGRAPVQSGERYKAGSRELSGSLPHATGIDLLRLAPSARFERAAFSSAGRRSDPLSYEGV